MSSPKRVAKRKRPVEEETEEVVEAPKAKTTSKKTAGSPAKLKRENTMAAVVKEGGQFLDRAAGSPAKRASSRLATSAKPTPSSPRPAKRAKKSTKAAKVEEKKEEVEEEDEEEEEEKEEEVEGKPVPQLVKGGSMLKVAKEAQHFLGKGSGSPMGKTRSQSAKAKQDESSKKKKPATPKKLVKQSTMADTAKEGAALLEKAGGSPATRLRPTKAAAKGKGKPAAKGKKSS